MKLKSAAVLLPALGYLALAPVSRADEATLEALRQQGDDRYRELSTRVADLEAALLSSQQQVRKLTDELLAVRSELAKGASDRELAGLKEDMERLRQAIKDLDQKRLADQKDNKDRIETEFRKLQKLIENIGTPVRNAGPTPPVSATRSSPTPGGPPAGTRPTGPETGYEYTIRSGDTLSGIVAALRAQGIMVTQAQVMNANPGVKWNSLRVGQKIFIPAVVQ
ncbi:MAG TPA: LysM peptidoglycan-binding domain-containing protein [Methylomirabilota bacterium]|nr:LysM peptidoglycan-binding domain-containing protein [Methylomirabilota bacterium]